MQRLLDIDMVGDVVQGAGHPPRAAGIVQPEQGLEQQVALLPVRQPVAEVAGRIHALLVRAQQQRVQAVAVVFVHARQQPAHVRGDQAGPVAVHLEA